MKLKDIVKNLEVIEATADPETEISGISYDSRATQPGDMFVAVKGFESDGHRFIPKAVSRGAAVVLDEFRAGKLGRITLQKAPVKAPKETTPEREAKKEEQTS